MKTVLPAVVAVVSLAWAVAGIVRPPPEAAVVGISRFTDSVTIVQNGIGWIPRFVSERRKLPRADGYANLEVAVDESTPPPAVASYGVGLRVEGRGPLPVSAGSVRELGWEEAWSELLKPRIRSAVAESTLSDLAKHDRLWDEVFPETEAASQLDLRAELDALFGEGGVRLIGATVRPRLDAKQLRRLAAAQIRAMSHPEARVVLIGLDGADWLFLDPLLDRGDMPNLARIIARGARGVLDAPKPMISPPIWTSIATGLRPEDHGILDFVTRDPDGGEMRPIGSYDRRVPAAWIILSALGLPVGVVGWWATWPAEMVKET
jgi:hypothetical protein